jgi:hypothetical protein
MVLTWEDLAKEYVQLAAPVLAPALAAVIATLLFRLVYSSKENARYAGVVLALLRADLGGKLNGKADAVLAAWNSAVKDAMSDKPATEDQALDKFLRSIRSECPLTDAEEQAVRAAAARTFAKVTPGVTPPSALGVQPSRQRVAMMKLGN